MKLRLILLLCGTTLSLPANQKTFLVFGGKSGWIGQKIMRTLQEQGHCAIAAQSRLEKRQDIEQEIARTKPDFIINAAGVVNKSAADWCQDHQQETIRANLLGALNLADICATHNIHMTNISTGCVYNYDAQHPMQSKKGFHEAEAPNLTTGVWRSTKLMLESLFKSYPHVLNLRIRMPVAADFSPDNTFVQLTKLPKVATIPNSITVLDTMLPLIPQMAMRNLTGIYNFVNPGVLGQHEILDLYRIYISPKLKYQKYSAQEQEQALQAGCYNELDTTKLRAVFPDVLNVRGALIQTFKKMKLLQATTTRHEAVGEPSAEELAAEEAAAAECC